MEIQALNRGDFIRMTGVLGAGLGFAVYLPACAPSKSTSSEPFAPNAWVRIAPDDTVTVVLSKSEMGQGIATGLPTILADELDASIDPVRFDFAPADPRYDVPGFGEILTGGGPGVRAICVPLRRARAAARAMLRA